MKKILALIATVFVAGNAYADTCSKNLMPMFTSFQASKLCSTFLGSSTISASLVPGTTNSYDIGNATHTIRTLYMGTSILPGTGTAPNLGSAALPFGVLYAGDATRVAYLGDDNSVAFVGSQSNVNFSILSNALTRLTVNTSGDLSTDATSGGNIIMNVQDKGVQVLSGATLDADVTTFSTAATTTQYAGSNSSGNKTTIVSNIADAVGGTINFLKTRAAVNSWNANTIVASGDDIGAITAAGADGVDYQNAAQILMESDGTPGAGDMPGRITFLTTPDGSATLTSAMVINNAQAISIASTLTSSRTSDFGWSVVAAGNQACNTTCTSACVVGQDTGTANVFVGCATATADVCLCAGSS